MIRVGHDFFHCWRLVLADDLGPQKTGELTLRFWDKVAEATARAYARGGAAAAGENDLEGLVRLMARSSEIMGERVRVEADGDDFLLIHEACPWTDSYREYGGGNCQPGCDRWFVKVAAAVLPGCRVRTERSIPAGGGECVRRFSPGPAPGEGSGQG